MKKNVKCIAAQTINLSIPKTCENPRIFQLKKLVNADVIEPCPESIGNPYKTICRPVPVRICNRIDMQKILPPKVCECPQKTSSEFNFSKKFFRLLNNILKTGIAGGLAYWTYVEGFWSDAEETENLYHRIIETVSPAFQEVVDVPKEIKLPHLENMKYNLLDGYNRLVLRIVGLIIVIPIMMEEKIKNLFSPSCHDQTDEKIDKNGIK